MDNFKEEVIIKRRRSLNSLLYALCWLAIAVFVLIAVISVNTIIQGDASGNVAGVNIMSIVYFLASGALAFLIWRNKDKLRTEYEYSFTNGNLDVSMVLNNSRRRYLTALDMKTVESAGEVRAAAFQRYLSMKDVKVHNWFLNREANLVYFYFEKNSAKHLIVIEPSAEMVGMIRENGYLGYGVWQEK